MASVPLPTVVVGAGVAGLACARVLADAGDHAVVVERSRGVGGRCATRRIHGQPVDHGVVFLHGTDPGFLGAVDEALGDRSIEGWPRNVAGTGPPCQPAAFGPRTRRVAVPEGISAFPKALARGIDVRRGTRVTSLVLEAGAIRVGFDGGESLPAADVVLALPAEQALRLIEPLGPHSGEAASACGLLETTGSLPCLTLIAGYSPGSPDPGWDVCYPERSAVLQLVAHDTAKRSPEPSRVLVYQARAAWSKARLEADPSAWVAELLDEAGRVVGAWATRTAWTDTQRWRYARASGGDEMAGPILLRMPRGGRIGLAGEIFAAGGGVEAAWKSGRALARRLLQEV